MSAQLQMLFGNAGLGAAVTLVAAAVICSLEYGTVATSALAGWGAYMLAVSLGRYFLARAFHSASLPLPDTAWLRRFVLGAAAAGVGWGGAALLIYPPARITLQVALLFIIGGMMLGGSSLLAPRREAFLAFLVPSGLAPACRLIFEGDQIHLVMGLLAGIFTVAIVTSTLRISSTIASSLSLQFENRELVDDLLAAKTQTETLNRDLEQRVRERTAELLASTEQLRAEVHQRHEVEDELLRARKLESLGVLAGGIAHDFNNLLAIIQGHTELAKSRLPPDDEIQPNLDQTMEASRRAAFLANQLLTFSKGGAPVRQVVSIAGLIKDSVELVRAGAPAIIQVKIAPGLKCARVDPGQIGQVLHNVLLNARESMSNSDPIEVSAANVALPSAATPGEHVRIAIRDHGSGIAPEDLPRIFDPYFTKKPAGRGLGLATAYAIVGKHGGQISVESVPGAGSLFTIDLPACDEMPARPLERVPARREERLGRQRILVMDDEAAIRSLVSAVLSLLGYEVETASEGSEAVSAYARTLESGKPFDAVILDLTVSGGMGGVKAAAKLKEIDPHAKLIVSSGYADDPVMADFVGYGFAGVIPKPWTSKSLGDVLEQVLSETC